MAKRTRFKPKSFMAWVARGGSTIFYTKKAVETWTRREPVRVQVSIREAK